MLKPLLNLFYSTASSSGLALIDHSEPPFPRPSRCPSITPVRRGPR